MRIKDWLQGRCKVIGMIHVGALPGTPGHSSGIREIVEKARLEAKIYQAAGIDGLLIENMHDRPYLRSNFGPEIVAAMTAIACEVKQACDLPCGMQILAAGGKEALAVAAMAGLDFIRAEGFVYGHIADEGYIDSCAGELLRFRRAIGAENVAIFTDIKKKHASHAITADVSIEETAHTAEFFKSDGLIVTGIATGYAADPGELEAVRKAVNVPVLIGSGITLDNISRYLTHAHGLIVGSFFKKAGWWENDVDEIRVRELMSVARKPV